MKTIYEIVQEYLNRNKKPEFKEISIVTDPDGKLWTYSEITNLKDPGQDVVGWIEFDSRLKVMDINEMRHVKIKGYINRYVAYIRE